MKPRVSQLAQSGATIGQAAVWNGTEWAPTTVGGGGGAIGAGELLMEDGVSAPPVPLENESRTDWLYAG